MEGSFQTLHNILPNAPLGYLNLTVQVIATIFMPAAMLFLLLLLNDKGIMGSMVNKSYRCSNCKCSKAGKIKHDAFSPWERISLFIAAFNLIFVPLLFFLPHPSLGQVLDSFA